MLAGEFKHTIDAKGRVFLPAKFRDDLGSNILIVKGLDKCLVAYSEVEWKKFVTRLDALGEMQSKEIKRHLMKSSLPVELDSQGRISISQDLRDYAGIEKEISFLGMDSYVEIWNGGELVKETDSYDVDTMKDMLKKAGF
jgi:mraZ protein